MSLLSEKLQTKHRAVSGNGNKGVPANTPIPQYGAGGRFVSKEYKKKTCLKIIIPIVSAIVILAGIIYLPQFFIRENENPYLVRPDSEAIAIRTQYVADNPTLDFDNDGLVNADEISAGCNPFCNDSDADGIYDGADENPLKADNTLYDAVRADGGSVDTAYSVNGIILWAADNDSLTYGDVVEIPGGYRFTAFKGWAKFSGDKYAYRMNDDGTHTLLTHRESENVWKIEGDCSVVLSDTQPRETNKISFFGASGYMQGGFGKLLSKILPDKGWITCRNMWLDDTYISTDENQLAEKQSISFDKTNLVRFGENMNSLQNLADLYATINAGNAVLASLYNEDVGEAIVEIYGYDKKGNLLVLDPENFTKTDVINITPMSTRSLDSDNKLSHNQRFSFVGCGFDSDDGATISFFAAGVKGAPILSSDTSEPETPSETDETLSAPEDTLPENGEYTLGENTYYFIDKTSVASVFIRKNEENRLEKCSVTDSGAFYVGEGGTKQVGKIVVDGVTYLYLEDRFAVNCYVYQKGDSYAYGSYGTSGSIYMDGGGKMATGWFTLDGSSRYATSDGVIQKGVFAKKDGKTVYLKPNGTIATNCLCKVDGRDVLLDSSGGVINAVNVSDLINKYMVN